MTVNCHRPPKTGYDVIALDEVISTKSLESMAKFDHQSNIRAANTVSVTQAPFSAPATSHLPLATNCGPQVGPQPGERVVARIGFRARLHLYQAAADQRVKCDSELRIGSKSTSIKPRWEDGL